MIGLRASINEHLQRKLKEASEKAAYRNFGHAAASIRKDVQQTIERAPRQPHWAADESESGGQRQRLPLPLADHHGRGEGPCGGPSGSM